MRETNGHDTCLCIFQGFLNFSKICCWYTLELPHRGNSKVHLQHNVHSINDQVFFTIKQGFHKFLNYLFLCFSIMRI